MWDEVLGHQQNKEFFAKNLLKPGSRPHALLFYGMGGIGKKSAGPAFCKKHFYVNLRQKNALRYLRELPFDGY